MLSMEAPQDVATQISEWKQKGKTIAFVPTMGNLHQGHLSLVQKASELADKVVVSIYVNPLQFGKNEDLDSYPRTLADDRQALQALKIDLLFLPDNQSIYGENMDVSTQVEVPGYSSMLCGEYRPGHFLGVTTVVNKLLNIVQADYAVFGEKDFQQVFIIKKMVRDLFIPVHIVNGPTVREQDGLAMSSRNQYLTEQQRSQASQIYRVLKELKDSAINGGDYRRLESNGVEKLLISGFKVDYVSFRSTETLLPADKDDEEIVLLVAAWMGKTRLIDNLIFQRSGTI